MYQRKAFLHWYKGEGMEEIEIINADTVVRDLITDYIDKEHVWKCSNCSRDSNMVSATNCWLCGTKKPKDNELQWVPQQSSIYQSGFSSNRYRTGTLSTNSYIDIR